jgi:hypothetical protein
VTELEGWGRYPRHASELLSPASPGQVSALKSGRTGLVARGNGRAYGDGRHRRARDPFHAGPRPGPGLRPGTALITVEAGVVLADLLAVIVPGAISPPWCREPSSSRWAA